MSIFQGSGVAIVTPFTEDDRINFEKLGEIIEFQIENGTDAIIICGTTGEASAMTHKEHLDAIEATVKFVNKRVPVIAGSGSNWTNTAIYLSVEAEKLGVDGLLVVSPYYNKATQKGLIQHFTKVANSVKVPIILYNVPSRTGCNILPETVEYLCKNVDNIIGLKDATGNIVQTSKTAALCGDYLDIYSGNDDQIVPVMSIGGKGVISVLANIEPKVTHDIVMSYLNGKPQEARKLQLEYFPLIDALFCEVNPIPVKAAMNMMGMNVGTLRLPLTEIEDHNKVLLANELKKLNMVVEGA